MPNDVLLKPIALLQAYANGVFPMASSRHHGRIRWYAPDPRSIIEFHDFVPGRHFRRLLRTHPFTIRVNTAFRQMMEACAAPRQFDRDSWISSELIDAYTELHHMGFAHSIEAWDGDTLAGGLYCVQLGAAVMGESMVSLQPDASKVCLLTLMQRMKDYGYLLLDTQYITTHLMRFGAVEISRQDYERRLHEAITVEPARGLDGAPVELGFRREAPSS